MSNRDSEIKAATKNTYGSPRVTNYGTLKDLTTGGSGNAAEASQGQKPRP